ncbi:MAG: sulfite exporter TauE/SafE family protein [Bacteroidota bacterium]
MEWYWFPVFFVVAALYSSVGFGGGSTYLAILSSLGIPSGWVRWIAYLCNITVTGKGSIHFFKEEWISLKEALPWVLASVPMAFLGGSMALDENLYLKVLGGTLLISGILMLFTLKALKSDRVFKHRISQWVGGGAIGFLSGLVGIGGGIFLAPLLHLSSKYSQKKIAALCSIYILFNSISGAIGFWVKNGLPSPKFEYYLLIPSVLFGGWLGNRFTFRTNWKNYLRIATAVLIMGVGIRLLLK